MASGDPNSELIQLRAERDRLLAIQGAIVEACGYPPGHYYSPLPSLAEVKANESQIWSAPPLHIPAIDLNEAGQLALFDELRPYYAELPFGDHPQPGLRYFYHNAMFIYADAILLFCLLRHLHPQRIIEVGSGFSSSVMLDTNDLFFDSNLSLTFIEPFPDRLLKLFKSRDHERNQLLVKRVQDVDLNIYESLAAGDILFIDSSHVAKVGSDVNWILFEVLPRLATGVVVHFHDVFYPFEYPKRWVFEGRRAWNECYALRAFLQYNRAFRIELWNSYLLRRHRDRVAAAMPLCLRELPWPMSIGDGSLWLRKV